MPSTGVSTTSFAGNIHAAVSSSMALMSSQSRRASASGSDHQHRCIFPAQRRQQMRFVDLRHTGKRNRRDSFLL